MGKMLDYEALSDAALRMAMPCRAGMPVPAIAEAGLSDIRNGAFLAGVLGELEHGARLDEALASTGLFPDYFTDMAAVGLATGKLAGCLEALHGYYLRRCRIRAALRQAVLQPLGMLAVTALVLAVMLAKIFPVFETAYAAAGIDPGPWTASAAAFGRFLSANWRPLGLALLAACGAVMAAVKCGLTALLVAWAGSNTGTGRTSEAARLVQALSMGLDSGMDPGEALEMACEASGNGPRAKACLSDSRSGAALPEALEKNGLVDGPQAAMLEAGIRSGSLPDAAAYVAGQLSDRAEAGIRRISGMVEPAVTLLGSGLAGGTIVLAMLPLLDAMSAIG